VEIIYLGRVHAIELHRARRLSGEEACHGARASMPLVERPRRQHLAADSEHMSASKIGLPEGELVPFRTESSEAARRTLQSWGHHTLDVST